MHHVDWQEAFERVFIIKKKIFGSEELFAVATKEGRALVQVRFDSLEKSVEADKWLTLYLKSSDLFGNKIILKLTQILFFGTAATAAKVKNIFIFISLSGLPL